jgi:hypothetical protein
MTMSQDTLQLTHIPAVKTGMLDRFPQGLET